jgi:hypothetical protein
MRTNLFLMLAVEGLILSWDPSQLILTAEYELGFQNAFALAGIGPLI